MARALLLAWANPVDKESESEFNAWYEGTHIPEVRAAIPSISVVHRYRAADLPIPGQPAHGYLAVYEMESEDVAAAAAALGSAASEGRLHMTAAMDVETLPPVTQWYTAAG
jgi:microcystin degradation protein MlrC